MNDICLSRSFNMNVTPIRDFLVIAKDEEEKDKRSAGGLYIAPSVEDKVITGVVVAAGSGRVTMSGTVVPLEVAAGERVAFNKHHAVEVKIGNESAWLLREDQVLCKIS